MRGCQLKTISVWSVINIQIFTAAMHIADQVQSCFAVVL